MSNEIVLKYCTDPNCTKCHGPFSDEALGQRTPEAIRGHNIVRARETGVLDLCDDPECPWCAELPERTPEAIAQDERQAAAFGGHDPMYHAALVVIANEEGAGRYARAINLVAKIWGKTPEEVLGDAVMIA